MLYSYITYVIRMLHKCYTYMKFSYRDISVISYKRSPQVSRKMKFK